MPTIETGVRELDRRISDGFDVRLWWNSHTDRVFVTVDDERSGESFTLAVDAADALEAFHHPFAYPGADHEARPQPREPLPASRPQVEDER